jgi:hypothetical protein
MARAFEPIRAGSQRITCLATSEEPIQAAVSVTFAQQNLIVARHNNLISAQHDNLIIGQRNNRMRGHVHGKHHGITILHRRPLQN